MIAVDSMIWIYNCDVLAPEHRNVHLWLEGEKNKKGIIDLEKVLVNTVIVMEIIHNLRRKTHLPPVLVYDYVLKMISLRNVTVAPFDEELLHISIHTFQRFYEYGIGGRDATILAAMLKLNVDTIATHDKNLLKLPNFERIDPTYYPPRILKKKRVH